MGLNKREVDIICYRGYTGRGFDHECISIHYVNDHN